MVPTPEVHGRIKREDDMTPGAVRAWHTVGLYAWKSSLQVMVAGRRDPNMTQRVCR